MCPLVSYFVPSSQCHSLNSESNSHSRWSSLEAIWSVSRLYAKSKGDSLTARLTPTINHQSVITSHPLFTNNSHKSPTIISQLPTTNHPTSTINHRLLSTNHQLTTTLNTLTTDRQPPSTMLVRLCELRCLLIMYWPTCISCPTIAPSTFGNTSIFITLIMRNIFSIHDSI